MKHWNWKRLLSMMVALSVALITTSGVAADPYQEEVDKGPKTVTLVLVGDAGLEQDMVFDEINKLLIEDINTTVNVKNIDWADYDAKYRLMFQAGEDFDCTFGATWLDYAGLANRGALLEITKEMQQNYCPNLMPTIIAQADYLRGMFVNGKNYALQGESPIYRAGAVYAVRGDLMEKYGIEQITNLDELFDYFLAIAQNESDMTAISGGDCTSWMLEGFLVANSLFWLGDRSSGVVISIGGDKWESLYTQDCFIDYAKKLKDLNEAGVFARGILSDQAGMGDYFRSGQSALFSNQIESTTATCQALNAEHPDWNVKVVDVTWGSKKISTVAPNMAWVINIRAREPERALMVLDKLIAQKEYYDLFAYGIEDVHVTYYGDLEYLRTERGAANYNQIPWTGGIDAVKRFEYGVPAEYYEMYARWTSESVDIPTINFVFDDTNVSNELAACNNIRGSYMSMLLTGNTPGSVEDTLDEMNRKLDAAGWNEVIAEAQAQYDAFLAGF